jgi:hypothetical protein
VGFFSVFLVLMSIMSVVSCGMNYLGCAHGGGCHGGDFNVVRFPSKRL